MKIKKVSTWKEDLGLTRPYSIAYERVDVVENLFVLIEAENGLIGIGAGSPDAHLMRSIPDSLYWMNPMDNSKPQVVAEQRPGTSLRA